MTMNKLRIADELEAAQAQIIQLQAENQRLKRVVAGLCDEVNSGMSLNDFQQRAHATSKNTQIGGDGLLYPVLGLVGESGELANKVKKIYRDKGGAWDTASRVDLTRELFDIQWYVAEIATQLAVDLDSICRAGLTKLSDRANHGVWRPDLGRFVSLDEQKEDKGE